MIPPSPGDRRQEETESFASVLVRAVDDGHGAHVRAREGAARGVGVPASD